MHLIPLVKLLIIYMKRNCLYVLCLMIFSVIAVGNHSCNKSDKDTTAPGNEKPGQITGMGNAGGVPRAKHLNCRQVFL